MEFDAPFATGPKLPSPRQSVVLAEDVIQFSPFTDYSLQPGDKVLAPWEPDRQRYGPATVLGVETREPQRGKGSCSDLPGSRRSQVADEARGESKGASLQLRGLEALRKTTFPPHLQLSPGVADIQIIFFRL